MGEHEVARYGVSAEELAKWLQDQGDDVYWNVDGDPRLSSRVSFPCPGDELADALRKIGKPLLVFDTCGKGGEKGESVTASDLDDLVETEELNAQVLQLSWKDSGAPWLLIKDEETSKSVARDASSSSSSSSRSDS